MKQPKQSLLGKRKYLSKEQIMESVEGLDHDDQDQEVNLDQYHMQDKDLDSFSNDSSSMILSKGSTTLKLSKIERKI